MTGIKGKSGGARRGSGRKTLKTEREIKEELQKYIPEAFSVVSRNLNENRSTDAWKVIDKFVPNKTTTELTGSGEKPFTVIVSDVGYDPNKASVIKPVRELTDPLLDSPDINSKIFPPKGKKPS